MTQEVATRESTAVATLTLSRDKIELIKRTVARGASDDELQLFLHVAQRSGLDPFARQIYAIKRWDSREKREIMQPQTSIDGYRLIASRTGRYVPGPKPTYAYKPDGTLLSATAYIKVLAGSEWHTVEAEAFWDEYVVTYEKDGKTKLGPMWQKMPHVMLAKCAEALVIRRAFPNETQGIYTSEEMGRANAEHAPLSAPKAADESFDPATGEVVETHAAIDVQAPTTRAIPPPAAAWKLSPKQQAYLFGLAKKKGWDEDDVKAIAAKLFNKNDPTTMTTPELNKVLTQLQGLPDAGPAQ